MLTTSLRRWIMHSFIAVLALLLTACDNDSSRRQNTETTTISGTAFKGPLVGATVVAFDVVDVELGRSTTDDDGAYQIVLNILYTGVVRVEVTGGSYVDEATGLNTALSIPIRAQKFIETAEETINITPLTELAVRRTAELGDITRATVEQGNNEIAAAFGLNFDIVTTSPVDLLDANNAGNPGNGTDYSLIIAGLAEMVQNNIDDNDTAGDTFEKALNQLATDISSDGDIDDTGLQGKLGRGIRDFFASPNNEADITEADTELDTDFEPGPIDQSALTFADAGPVTKNFGEAAFTNAATGGSGSGALSYSSNNTAVATINSSTGEVTITGGGSAIITATKAADSEYNQATANYTVNVSKVNQAALSFTDAGPVTKNFGEAAFTNAATGGSGSGTLSYSSDNAAVAAVNSDTGEVTITGGGSATITATKTADNGYNQATANYTVNVSKVNQAALSFTDAGPVTKNFGEAAFTNAATGGSGSGALSYSSDNAAVATVNSNTGEVTIIGGGSATITATKTADNSYNQATANYTVNVSKVNQAALNFNDAGPVAKNSVDAAFTNAATGGSGSGALTYSSSNTAVATIDSNSGEVTLVGVGSATITATKAADDDYNSANTNYTLNVSLGVIVTGIYSNAADWNGYVKNNGADVYNADNTACDGSETGGYSACIHGGEKLAAVLTGYSSCTGLTASDALDAFDWICDDSTNPVRMVTTGLKTDKNLSDLLNFTIPAWLNNSITVLNSSTTIAVSPAGVWWGNPVVEDNDGGTLNTPNTVYIVTADTTESYTITADSIALVVQPGMAIDADNGSAVSGINVNFMWLEGTMSFASAGGPTVFADGIKFSVLRALDSTASTALGIALSNALNNQLINVSASNSFDVGITFSNSDYNTLNDVEASANNNNGISLDAGSDNNVLNNVRSFNNRDDGIFINAGWNNRLLDVTSSHNGTDGSGSGITLENSSSNYLSSIVTSNNPDKGVWIMNTAQENTAVGIFGTSNGYSLITVEGSSDNFIALVTALNNTTASIDTAFVNNLRLTNAVTANARGTSYFLDSAANSRLRDIVVAHHNATGLYVANGSTLTFSGLLKVGQNLPDCDDDNTTTPDFDGTGSCAAVAGATLQAADLDDSTFVGKALNDTANTSDINGSAAFSANLDWTRFDNRFRSWSKDGTFLTFATAEVWNSGTGHIVDASLLAGDTQLLGQLNLIADGDPANTLTHTFGAGSVTYLINAIEINDDEIGNNNGLCESNETCLYTPNLGAYQGHGVLESAGTFTDGVGVGSISGVTLMQYQDNGY